MSSQRFTFRAAVYLILEQNDQILLMRRFQTGWRDGSYTLPAGHLDGNESIFNAMAREAHEETGITIKADDLKVVHIVHQFSDKEYVDFYLETPSWQGSPTIMEPNKCDDLQWFPKSELPQNLLPNVRDALLHYANGLTFSEFSWD